MMQAEDVIRMLELQGRSEVRYKQTVEALDKYMETMEPPRHPDDMSDSEAAPEDELSAGGAGNAGGMATPWESQMQIEVNENLSELLLLQLTDPDTPEGTGSGAILAWPA